MYEQSHEVNCESKELMIGYDREASAMETPQGSLLLI